MSKPTFNEKHRKKLDELYDKSKHYKRYYASSVDLRPFSRVIDTYIKFRDKTENTFIKDTFFIMSRDVIDFSIHAYDFCQVQDKSSRYVKLNLNAACFYLHDHNAFGIYEYTPELIKAIDEFEAGKILSMPTFLERINLSGVLTLDNVLSLRLLD